MGAVVMLGSIFLVYYLVVVLPYSECSSCGWISKDEHNRCNGCGKKR